MASQDGSDISPVFETQRSAYVHVPFCRRRCFYCDFPVSVTGDRRHGGNFSPVDRYVDSLCQEIQTWSGQGKMGLETVFFGGGTPSLLTVGQVEKILRAIDGVFGIVPGAEISIEVDPGTFDRDKIAGYIGSGVNRFSLGVQAFQDELLQVCGRSHSVAEIHSAIEILNAVGADNFSIDLMSGLPYQTPQQWQESLSKAVAIAPAHISVYDTIVEPKTPFARYYEPGVFPLPDDDTSAEFYRQTQKVLTTAGYEHYEISNYAKPGFQCRHNRVYWHNRSYYGFGMGATSYVNGQRFSRPRTTTKYAQWVETFVANNGKINCEVVTERDRLLETLMLGLRLAEGVSLDAIASEFGQETVDTILEILQPYIEKEWVKMIPERNAIRLSDPEGFLYSNAVLSSLFADG